MLVFYLLFFFRNVTRESWGIKPWTVFTKNESIFLWLIQPHGFSGLHCGFSDCVDLPYGTKWGSGNKDYCFIWLLGEHKLKGSMSACHSETNTEFVNWETGPSKKGLKPLWIWNTLFPPPQLVSFHLYIFFKQG